MLKLALILGVLLSGTAAFDKEWFSRYDDEPNDYETYKMTKFDLLVVSQMWPQTACWDLNKKWTNKTSDCCPCDIPEAPHDWTIHGLWPSSSFGKHPSFCNKKLKFNKKLLNNALLAQMEEKWRTYKLTNTNLAFWTHEWDKHGTCALQLNSTSTLPKYFSTSIKLLDKYNIGKILADADIRPGYTYKYQNVANAIQNAVGVKADIDCAVHSMTKEKYLNEISLCFDKSFKLTDCPASKSNCKTEVWYPEKREICKFF